MPKVAIICPAGQSCPQACNYCFHRDTEKPTKFTPMDLGLLETAMRQHFSLVPQRYSPHIVWHGGEFTLIGAEYFREVLAIQKRLTNRTVINRMQTGAVLIDDTWAQLLKAGNCRVGISIDGKKRSHNRNRRLAGGQPSFDHVMRGIDALRRHRVHFGAIHSLTSNSVETVDEDFDFFAKELGMKGWAYNPVSGRITPDEFTTYLIQVFHLWLRHGDPTIRIREIHTAVTMADHKTPSMCSHNGSCNNYYVITDTGDIYPCDRAWGPEFHLGNVEEKPLEEILEGEKRKQYLNYISLRPPKCQECEAEPFCNNGCAAQRDATGIFDFCETRLLIFRYVSSAIAQIEAEGNIAC